MLFLIFLSYCTLWHGERVKNISPEDITKLEQLNRQQNIVVENSDSKNVIVFPKQKMEKSLLLGESFELSLRSNVSIVCKNLDVVTKNREDLCLYDINGNSDIKLAIFILGDNSKNKVELDIKYGEDVISSIVINVDSQSRASFNLNNWNGFKNFKVTTCYMNAGLKCLIASMREYIFDVLDNMINKNIKKEDLDSKDKVRFAKFFISMVNAMNLANGFNKDQKYEIVLKKFITFYN
jgi:ubiquitin C-terminal hydrolase